MKAPYFKIYIKENQKDISDLVEMFKYEDSLEEDNLIQLDIKSDYAFETIDLDEFIVGTILEAKWGFAGGLKSSVQEAKITDIEVTYADRVKLKVSALDMGNSLKKESSLKIWKGKTIPQIVKEIASKYGLKSVVEASHTVLGDLPQGNKSDFAFLEDLASKGDDGDYIFYIRSDTLYFEKRGVEKKAKFLFSYGEESLISFSPKLKESMDKNAGTSSIGVNPKTKKTEKTNDKNNGKSLGTNMIRRNNESEFVKKGTEKDFEKKGTEKKETEKGFIEGIVESDFVQGIVESDFVKKLLPLPIPTDESSEASSKQHQNTVNSVSKKNKLKTLIGTLKIEGNPVMKTNELVTISNVALRHTGNWLIEKVTHNIGSSEPYTCTCSLLKDGTIKKLGKDGTVSSDVNKSKGDKNQPAYEPVYVRRNNDSDFIDRGTKSDLLEKLKKKKELKEKESLKK